MRRKRKPTYYYKRRAPWGRILFLILLLACGAGGYWLYINFYQLPTPQENDTVELIEERAASDTEPRILYADAAVSVQSGGVTIEPELPYALESDTIIETNGGRAVQRAGDLSVRVTDNAVLSIVNPTNSPMLTQTGGRAYVISKNPKTEYILNLPQASSFGRVRIAGTEYAVNHTNGVVEIISLSGATQAAIYDGLGEVQRVRLDQYERAVINPNSTKFNLLRVYDFQQIQLTQDSWYVWNRAYEEPVATEEEEEQIAEQNSAALSLTAIDQGTVINLEWEPYSEANFKRYELIRSTNENLTYANGEQIASATTREFTSFSNTSITQTDSYYYRLCVITLEGEIVCGPIAPILRSEGDEGADEAEQEEENEVENTEENVDTEDPDAPALSGRVSSGGVLLTWSVSAADDIIGYRVLRSQENPVPGPGDQLATVSTVSFTDLTVGELSPGTYYYRVCAEDSAGNTGCSNVVRVQDGEVQ